MWSGNGRLVGLCGAAFVERQQESAFVELQQSRWAERRKAIKPR